MPPNKGKGRAAPEPSDYETDSAPPALAVAPPSRSVEELNFRVLKGWYPELLAIEHITPYAVLYTIEDGAEQWEKVDIEGTLFICQLLPSPAGAERFCVIILNRRSLDNFFLELTSDEEIEISDPYIILQGDGPVYGLWIHADPPPASTQNCRTEAAAMMLHILARAKAQGAKAAAPTATEQVDTASSLPMGRQLSLRDLFGHQRQHEAAPTQDVLGQLFNKAKQDYNG
jgi:hypothetical protein